MRVFGLCRVRNEADVIGVTVMYHLAAGVDRVLVLDNGSSDGTREVLAELERSTEVRVLTDRSAFRSGTMTTRLARAAYEEGADWVLPFDADEFWYSPGGSVREVLAAASAGALRVGIVNFVQRRDQLLPRADGLLTVTCRVPAPRGTAEAHEALVEGGTIAFVEGTYPRKWACRPTGEIVYGPGSHGAVNLSGVVDDCEELLILHAPLRSRAALDAKARAGERVIEAGFEGHNSWHLRRWARLARQGKLDAEWRANSHADGALDVYGEPHPVVVDRRLADAVGPFIAC